MMNAAFLFLVGAMLALAWHLGSRGSIPLCMLLTFAAGGLVALPVKFKIDWTVQVRDWQEGEKGGEDAP